MQYRQGDVFIERVNSIPEDLTPVARDNGRTVLAYGEVTGHAHAIHEEVELFEEREGRFYLKADVEATVVHEEHGPITLDPGMYRVTRQREYTPARIVFVAD